MHGQIIGKCVEMCGDVHGHVPGQMMDMCMVRYWTCAWLDNGHVRGQIMDMCVDMCLVR